MIKLSRFRHHTTITSGLRGKRRKQKELLLLKGRRDGNLEFNSEYWKKAKNQLKSETHSKCAYCEADTAVVAHGDVEHFRPKAAYWWLAYCYDNYLYSCQICNQVYKSDNFPIRGTKIPEPVINPLATDEQLEQCAGMLAPDPLVDSQGLPMATFRQRVDQELANLVDPYYIDPAALFAWEADNVLEEVRLIPRDSSNSAINAAQAAEDYLGINREELRELRWREYHKLSVFRDVLVYDHMPDGIVQSTKDIIKEMMADSAPFAGMVRYYVQVAWNLVLD